MAQSRFYVPEESGTLVKIIDPATNTLTGSVTVGQSPSNAASSPGDGSRVYVSYIDVNSRTWRLAAIDTITNTVVQTIVPPSGESNVISADGKRLYFGAHVLDTTSMTLLPDITLPGGTRVGQEALSPDGTRLYVGDANTGNIYFVSTSTGTVVDTIPETPCVQCNGYDVGTPALVISPDGTRLYAAHGGNRELLTAYDTATKAALLTTTSAYELVHMSITPDGNKVYAFEPLDDGPYFVFNTGDLVVRAIGDYTDAWPAVAFTQSGATAYMTHFGNNGAVAEIDVASDTILTDIPLNTGTTRSSPYSIARHDVPSASAFSSYSLNSVRFHPNEVDIHGTFGTSGTVNPPAQRFTYVFGAYGFQIPAGSFTGGSGHWTYAGTLNGLYIEASISNNNNQTYSLSLTLKANNGIANQQLPLNTLLELGSSLYGTAVAN
jgi:DNA-binding beta-propeller fold protein YncE